MSEIEKKTLWKI